MDHVALVTGATSAIGAQAGRTFAAAGYAVALVARRKNILDELASEIRAAGGRALAIEADVTSATDVKEMLARTVATFGGLDVAFNNAGSGAPPTPLADVSQETFEDAVRVNCWGRFCARVPR
jgi:NAD(P)-dependent dehydrogenase (short-subunit alcohol dehydrogenase family)